MTRRHTPALLIALAALALAACGAPPQPTTQLPTAAVPDATAAEATPAPDSPDTTAAPPATAPAAPTPPPGWQELTLSELGLSLYAPEGWAAEPDGAGSVTLHDPIGDAWAQIAEPENIGSGSESATAGDLFAATLAAFRENGDFGEAQPIETRGGLDAVQVSGAYYTLDEHLLIGLAVGGGHVYAFSGHGPGLAPELDGEWAELEPIFETMFASLALAGD